MTDQIRNALEDVASARSGNVSVLNAPLEATTGNEDEESENDD